MMAAAPRSDGSQDVSKRPHVPVLLAEVLEALAAKPGDAIVDGTFGAGGYSRAILETGARVIAIDRDPDAIAGGAPRR